MSLGLLGLLEWALGIAAINAAMMARRAADRVSLWGLASVALVAVVLHAAWLSSAWHNEQWQWGHALGRHLLWVEVLVAAQILTTFLICIRAHDHWARAARSLLTARVPARVFARTVLAAFFGAVMLVALVGNFAKARGGGPVIVAFGFLLLVQTVGSLRWAVIYRRQGNTLVSLGCGLLSLLWFSLPAGTVFVPHSWYRGLMGSEAWVALWTLLYVPIAAFGGALSFSSMGEPPAAPRPEQPQADSQSDHQHELSSGDAMPCLDQGTPR